ncbi:MAG: hypothetical protein HZC28_04380 [Spirochaetes bacterium]|nr:hypothetical protein [Spirochaetota bacterium]
MKPNYITIKAASITFTEEKLRTPLMFGGGVVTAITKAAVSVTVENKAGKTGTGRGQILLSDLWAFPSLHISHEAKDAAMRLMSRKYLSYVKGFSGFGHPVDIYMESKPHMKELCDEVTRECSLRESFPFLAALVCASPVDMALHDAMGIAAGVSSYDLYGADAMDNDVSRYLGSEFRGRCIAEYLRRDYRPELPVFHLVGGADKLYKTDVTKDDPADGYPVSLEEWIERDRVFCFKVKLKGKSVDEDAARTIAVAECVEKTLARLNMPEYFLTIDQNEMCDAPAFDLEYLRKLKAKNSRAHEALLYIEQPTSRDIVKSAHDMRALSRLKPVLVDEGMVDIETMNVALSHGWSGFALKVCKGLSSALIYTAMAEAKKLPYAVQDLTNPGLSLIASAGFAARITTVKGFESNVFQFIPSANTAEAKALPDFFSRSGGVIRTGVLNGNAGLGYSPDMKSAYRHGNVRMI